MSLTLLRCRIIFYTAVILMHLSNILYMSWFAEQSRHIDQKALLFKKLEYRYFATWNFIMQITYSIIGITCDFLMMRNLRRKNYQLPDIVSDLRDVIYAGIVVPCSFVVFTIFWVLYAYDRSLIFPEYLDAVIPPISNHVIHTIIVPVAMFDIVFRPRTEPHSHMRFTSQLFLNLVVYMGVILITHHERKIWLYPILEELNGTVYFYLALALAGSLFFIFYYVQWPLTRMIHGSANKQVKKTQVVDKKKKKKRFLIEKRV